MPTKRPKTEKRPKVALSCPSFCIPAGERNALGKLFAAWRRLEKPPREFFELVETAGYSIGQATLRSWRASVEKGTTPVGEYENAGRRALLSPEQKQALVGHVLEGNDKGEVATPADTVLYARNQFGVGISTATARRTLKENGLSLRVAKRAAGGLATDTEKLARICKKWLLKVRELGLIPDDPSLLGSVDFTFCRHTTGKVRTYGMTGW